MAGTSTSDNSPDRIEKLEAEIQTLQRKLEDSFRLSSLGSLTAGVVHEINTPIASILSNNDVMVRTLESLQSKISDLESKNEPPTRKIVETVATLASLSKVDRIACDRIIGVIRSLKTFARKEDDERRKVDIHDLLADAARLCNCEFKRRVLLVTHFGELPPVYCYPQRLSQVFLNLLVNASQAIDGEGQITVATRVAEPGWIEISISDTGRGIDPAVCCRIFETGFTTKPIGVGTGLGLALSREIVQELHGGSLEFQSELGVGTTFIIRLPVGQARQDTPAGGLTA